MSFVNKVVIVTGASSGIGEATAILFAKEGANVVLVGRNEEKLLNVYEKCVEFGNKCLQVKADISNDGDAKRIIEKTIEIFGKLDVLVNNAGLIRFAKIQDDNIMEVFDTIINTNLRAQVLLTHLAIPYLIKTKGNIVNVSSVAGNVPPPMPTMTAYCVSKAALNHFTRGAAAEFAAHGVRVNTVSPGPVNTNVLLSAGINDPLEKLFPTPLQRISEPHEIGDLILFLASDKAQAITGSEFVSDNGFMLKR